MPYTKYLLAGLGNPGKAYEYTRHNAGFLFLDMFLEDIYSKESKISWQEKYNGYFFSFRFPTESSVEIFFLKPQTYMNLSGSSVCRCLKEENLSPKQMVVLHDEIELPFGEIRWKEGGGHRGHNGLRDIIQKCGSDFYRIRIGVGRPADSKVSVADFLLSPFSSEERSHFPEMYGKIKELILNFLGEQSYLLHKK